jgi:hypothetical protein
MSGVLRKEDATIPDLDALELTGEIIFIPVGGSNLALWASRLQKLNRPEFHLFDRDEEPPTTSKHQATVDQINNRNGCKAVLTSKKEMENYLHQDAIKAAREIEISFGDFDDVPTLAAEAVHNMSTDTDVKWDDIDDDKKKGKKTSKAKSWLNTEAASKMTIALLKERDPDDEVLSWFKSIKSMIETVP